MIRYLTFFVILTRLSGQVEVVILHEKVGSEIDIHENRFYRIFPDEKGFVNAQIIDAGNGNFRITIVKQIQGMETTVRRYIDQDDFQKIQNRIDQLPEFTKERNFSQMKV